MKLPLITFNILLFSVLYTYGQPSMDMETKKKFNIHSKILNENRVYLLSLPDSYNESTNDKKKYPILILLAGSTFFKTASGVVHFMSSDRNRNYFMPETIIVAIENVNRERDFTLTKLKTKRPNRMGGGRNLLKKIIEQNLIEFLSGILWVDF